MKMIAENFNCLLVAGLLLLSLQATAHHSFPAQYDINQPVTLSGTVTEVQWTNPHIFIMMDVMDDTTGESVNWTLELGGPNALLRLGWKRDSLKPADHITVEGSLARDGSPLVNATSIIMTATGRKMLAGSSRDSGN
jgi:hypothetical protein